MIIMLQVTSGQALGDSAQKSFDRNGGSFGRASHNDWVLPDEAKIVSGQHGMIYFEGGKFYLTDISTNGIFVNSSESPLGKGNVTALSDGDSLRFGEYEVKVSVPVVEDSRLLDQHTTAADSSPIEQAVTPQPSRASQIGKEPGSFDVSPGDIESPGFDPLAVVDTTNSGIGAIGSMGSSGDAGTTGSIGAIQSTANSLSSNSLPDNAAIPNKGYQRSPPMNDPFTNPAVSSDPAVPTPPGQAHGSVIPEDWDVTGNSKSAADADQSPAQIIPEDIQLFDETASNQAPLLPPQTTQPPGLEPVGQKTSRQTALPSTVQLSPGQNAALPAAGQMPSQTGSGDASYQAFMQGLGLQLTSLNPSQDPLQVMTTTGRLFREVIQGLMILLQARSELKNQFRMSATTIRPSDNNPLKFSPNVDEALQALFADERTGYLQSDAAMKEGIRDIRNHQMAMIAGMQSAFATLLQRLNPDQFSAGSKGSGVKTSLLSGGKKSRSWEQYCDYYDNNVVKSGNAFQLLFGEDFNKAYEEQLRMLESSRE